MKMRFELMILVMAFLLSFAIVGTGSRAIANSLLIEDGENTSEWWDGSGGGYVVSSVGDAGSRYMQIAVNRDPSLGAIMWWPAGPQPWLLPDYDWSSYTALEFDMKISSPGGQVAPRIADTVNGGEHWNGFLGWANSTDTGWHHYTMSLVDPGNPQLRDKVRAFSIYFDTGNATQYTVGLDNIQLTGPVVPEPSSVLALMSGIGGLMFIRRRK